MNGVLNAVEFHGTPVGSVLAVGPGAGGGATSSAVLSDLIDIAAGRGGLAFGKPSKPACRFQRGEKRGRAR